MLERIISGGQSGADQGALRAARAMGVPTGGTAPKGWLAEVLIGGDEDFPAPSRWAGRPCHWLADYGLVEAEAEGFPVRTVRNVLDSDETLWFGDPWSAVGRCTLEACQRHGRPAEVVRKGETRPSMVLEWL